jgi:myo-inositol-1(or 4)-monophosphatase
MNEKQMVQELIAGAAVVVRQAGTQLVERRAEIGQLTGLEEGGREVKLLADQITDEVILGGLRKTGLAILSEEAGWKTGEREHDWRWVVDPLDGSFNYMRGIPYCGVSVGLMKQEEPVAGLIFDLSTGQLVTGIVGEGAYAENQPLNVSRVTDAAQAVLTTGFPARMDYEEKNLAGYIAQIRAFQKVRMLGSAVQSCLNVASGRMDAYFEEGVMLWDVAAGLAIMKAAGAHCEVMAGERDHALYIWACTPGLAELNPLRKVMRGL